MSVASLGADVAPVTFAARRMRASFGGLVRGELRKLIHLRITWVLAAVITLLIVGAQLLLVTGPDTGRQVRNDPLGAFYTLIEGDFALVRVFSGIFLLVIAAHVIGLEYQQGTIRILLGRGVGRLQLLGAKVTAILLVGLALIVGALLIELLFATGLTLALADGHQPWQALNGAFWGSVGYYLLCLAINTVATLALGVAAAVVGRSLAFGLAVGLSWFAVDNLMTIPLSILVQVTHSAFWANLSGALLGPVLNRLPDEIAPPWTQIVPGPHGAVTVTHTLSGFGPLTLVPVPGSHALLVIGIYIVVFAVVAVVLTRRRDVLE
ncbi:MAG: ABC transporter permease subunit [Ktedonobacterales bacterium]